MAAESSSADIDETKSAVTPSVQQGTKSSRLKVPALIRRLTSRKKSQSTEVAESPSSDNPVPADEPGSLTASDARVPKPGGTPGKRLAILSIDGGGVRGIIPSVLLEYLESQLQKIDGEEARIADYFDVVAGTSTGGLIAAMLTAPDATKEKWHGKTRPLFTATQTKNFYFDKASTIFPKPGFLSGVKELFSSSKYSATPLTKLLIENFKDIKIADAVTDVLITSFDVKTQQAVFFDKKVASPDRDPLFNARYVDACRGTSAAPTYLPPHQFEVSDIDKPTGTVKIRQYNLIDGGIAANNPTQVAVVHAVKEVVLENKDSPEKKRITDFAGYEDLLVLSLGTGSNIVSADAKEMASWGSLDWILNDGKQPIISMLQNSSAYLVDFDMAIQFQSNDVERNYLRIQTKITDPEMARLDNADKKNLENLVELAKDLLNKNAKYRNALNGQLEEKEYVKTNKQALDCFAKWLSEEQKARLQIPNPTTTSAQVVETTDYVPSPSAG